MTDGDNHALIAQLLDMRAVVDIGAAYLMYLGITTFFADAAPGAGDNLQDRRDRRLYTDGLALQMANPKAILFYSALLPQFIDPNRPVAFQVAVLGVSSVVAEFFVLLGYGILAGKASRIARQPLFL